MTLVGLLQRPATPLLRMSRLPACLQCTYALHTHRYRAPVSDRHTAAVWAQNAKAFLLWHVRHVL